LEEETGENRKGAKDAEIAKRRQENNGNTDEQSLFFLPFASFALFAPLRFNRFGSSAVKEGQW